MSRVLCAGHVNWDVTLRLDRLPRADGESAILDTRQTGGGSAANVAVDLAGLDCPAAVVGSVGGDDNGLLARRDLEAADVDLSGLATVDGVTTTKYLLVDADGRVAVLGLSGVNEALGPGDVDPALVESADHVHLTAQRPATAARIAAVAGAADVPVSVDPGRRVAERDFGPVFDLADVLFVNRAEFEAMDELPSVRVVVRKFGDDGAAVETPDATYRHPGFDLPTVDETGAGDAFAAGFIAARLRGDDLETALAVANACGALGAGAEGPKTSLDWEVVDAVLAGERPGF